MSEKDTAITNGHPLLINVPPFLRKFPYWAACGTPKDKLDDEHPTKKAPLNVDGYGSWDTLYPSPEAALEAMLKLEHGYCISFIIPPEPMIIGEGDDAKLVVCCDFDFKNPATIVHPDAPRHNDIEKLGAFVVSCSTYCEFSISDKGYHVWALAGIPVPKNPISDKNGVGIFFKRQNVVFTGKKIPGSQADVHQIPDNVLLAINLWSKGPEAKITDKVIGIGDEKFELPDKILDGSKHTCFRNIALSMANKNMTVDEIMFVCTAMNENGRVVPPVPQTDMDTKVKNLAITAVRKVAKEKAERAVHPEYANLYSYKLVAKGEGFEEKLTLDYTAIVAWLHNKFHTVSFKDGLYVYNGEVYIQDTSKASVCGNEVRIFLETIQFPGTKTGIAREIINQLVMYEPVMEYPFNVQEGLLPVGNGVLSFDFENNKVELKPYSPEYKFTLKLPVIYDEKASGETLKNNVLSKYVSEYDLPVLYMVPAMAILQLIKHRTFKKAVVCEGDGNSGKTTYLEWLLELFSLKYCASISLHEISEDRFAFAQLEGKILNSYDELSDIRLDEIDKFKALTGRQDHKIEKKGIDGYDTILTAFHIFATNRPPTVSEKVMYDNAFWNRWMYLHFDNIFEIDMRFKEKWFTEENVSGSFNDVIKMVMEIEKLGCLPVTQPAGVVKDQWMNHAEPFLTFVMKNMQDSISEQSFDKDHLLNSFRDWCFKDENNISPRAVPTTTTGLTEKILKHHFIPKAVGKRTKTQDDRKWVYRSNMAWRDDSPYKPKVDPEAVNAKIT